jgi:nucleotide-binding universal stress UspA family protein
MEFRRILVPTDFSERSYTAFQVALKHGQCMGATLVLFHVIPREQIKFTREILIEGKTTIPGYTEEELMERRKAKMMNEFREHFPNYDKETVRIDTEVRVGNPVEEILKAINELDIDAVVMGTHGRTGLDLVLIGSVAEKVVRHAEVPVTTVKAVK